MSRARDNANLGAQAGSGLDASDITSGALPVGVTGGSGLNALSASNLSAGTVPDARFPATLPATSGVNLTAINATNLGSGTVPDARFPATLPAASGANLTALPAANLSGTITSGTQDAITRLGTVTVGNLSNTAIVYPAGHVVQVKKTANTGQSSTDATGFTYKTSITCAITPVLDNSIMSISVACSLYHTSSTSMVTLDLYRNLNSVETYNLSGQTRGIISTVPHGDWKGASFVWMDDTSAMSTRGDKNLIVYNLSAISPSGATAYINRGSDETHMIITEYAV